MDWFLYESDLHRGRANDEKSALKNVILRKKFDCKET